MTLSSKRLDIQLDRVSGVEVVLLLKVPFGACELVPLSRTPEIECTFNLVSIEALSRWRAPLHFWRITAGTIGRASKTAKEQNSRQWLPYPTQSAHCFFPDSMPCFSMRLTNGCTVQGLTPLARCQR
jgi:hypothetical protein